MLCVSVALFVTAGCSTSEPGSPIANPGSQQAPQTTSPSAANRYGAPSVSKPLDATRLLTQPCGALTKVQLQSLNLAESGTPDTDSAVAKNVGPSCTFSNSGEGSSVAVSFLTGNKNGLADTYRAHAGGDFSGYWIEATVNGYPGVFKDSRDNRKDGHCVMNVGISDTLAFLVIEQDRLGEKSCERAMQVATFVVQTLKAGG
ncbi:DUF3558 domain-containing protein [Kibdelosporangium aridum]|nr:DUF3558 domain-containing protein [Kibdelosporangium aridum]